MHVPEHDESAECSCWGCVKIREAWAQQPEDMAVIEWAASHLIAKPGPEFKRRVLNMWGECDEPGN